MAWGALLRIGEILNAYRADLILPSDVGNTIDDVLLKIQEPKTRYRSARHQAGKLEQYDLIEIVRIGFGRLGPQEKLWHLSGATLRSRLTKLLSTLGLPHLPTHVPKALTLASFRPGGATHLIAVSESAELVRRRGRWASFRTMEMYLQEVAASTYMNEISEATKEKVLLAMRSWVSLRIQKHQPSLLPRQGLKLHFFSAVQEVCEAGNQSLFIDFTHFSHHDHLVAFHTEGTKGNTRLFPVSCMHQPLDLL